MIQRKLASKFKTIVTLLVATQIATGSRLSFAAANGSSSSDSTASSEEERQAAPLLNLANELDQAKEGDLPREFDDSMHLARQRLQVVRGSGSSQTIQTYSLNDLDFSRPAPTPPNFDRDVKVEIDPLTREAAFVWRESGTLTYRIPIEVNATGPSRIAAVARDAELLILLSESGELFVLDMGYARDRIFKDPIPVVRLTHSRVSSGVIGGIQARFVSRGMRPIAIDSTTADLVFPVDRPAGASGMIRADHDLGHLYLFTEDGKGRRALGLFDRSVIMTQLYTAEAFAAIEAHALAPAADSEKTGLLLGSLLKDSELRRRSAAQSSRLAPFTQQALAALPKEARDKLVEQALLNSSRRDRKHDSMTTQEWTTFFKALSDEAERQIESDKKITEEWRAQLRTMLRQGEFGPEWRELAEAMIKRNKAAQETAIPKAFIHRAMTSRGMKLLGLLAGGAALAKGADLTVFGGVGGVWATYLLAKAYRDIIPNVLKDEVYRVTLLKSTIALTAFVPLLYSIGHLYGKMSGRSWSAVKSLVALGMRINGALTLPFYHHLARIARQPLFMESLKNGVSPFANVRADSALGRSIGLEQDARTGLTNPFLTGENFKQATARNSKALAALSTQRARARSLAWTLALVLASEQTGVDPASLAALIAEGNTNLARESLGKIVDRPDFKRRVVDYQRELELNLIQISSRRLLPESNQVSTEEMTEFYAMAKAVGDRAKGANELEEGARRWWNKARAFPSRFAQGFATFGTPEFEFLMAAEPDKFVASAPWRQFVTDYLLAVGQLAVEGPRADLSKPEDLAAKEGNFLSTNEGHRFDMVEQVRVYGIDVPGRFALIYQKMKPVNETAYDPIEGLSLGGVDKKEGLLRGVTRWVGGALNLHRGGYGHIYTKTLVRRIKTVQAAALMAILGRHFFGGQDWGVAGAGFLYTLMTADRAYAWLWAPVNRGTQVYEEGLEENKARLMEAKTELSRGLRLGDNTATLNGTKKLIALYSEEAEGPIPELRSALDQAERMISSASPEEMAAYRQTVQASTDTMLALQTALFTGDARTIEEARTKLLELYQKADGQNPVLRLNLTAIDLLTYALKEPPFATAPRSGLVWLATLTGAYLTTKWGAEMMIATFHPDVAWGPQLFETAWKSAVFFTVAYYGQKAIDRAAERWAGSRAQAKLKNTFGLFTQKWQEAKAKLGPGEARQPHSLAPSCHALFGGT